MKNTNKNYVALMAWIISLNVVGFMLGMLTKNSVDNWYKILNRAPLTPPDYLFGVAWTILYILIAIGGWLIWESELFCGKWSYIKKLYVIQLLLNWGWMPLFFYCHQVGFALLWMACLIVVVWFLMVGCFKKFRIIFWLFLPYFIWLLFAAYLNFYICKYN